MGLKQLALQSLALNFLMQHQQLAAITDDDGQRNTYLCCQYLNIPQTLATSLIQQIKRIRATPPITTRRITL